VLAAVLHLHGVLGWVTPTPDRHAGRHPTILLLPALIASTALDWLYRMRVRTSRALPTTGGTVHRITARLCYITPWPLRTHLSALCFYALAVSVRPQGGLMWQHYLGAAFFRSVTPKTRDSLDRICGLGMALPLS
jgi:hypothetical protein